MTFDQHAQSFGAAADAYERGRPGYPDEVAAWLVPDGTQRVVDVGAGTGKFTRTLVGRATEVVAVEPDAAMRDRLTTVLPDVRALDGTGEAIPLADGSADVVTFAQAWHWVDPRRGATEVARVLRPGGVLGLVWNVRDESLPWAKRLGEVVKRPESLVMDYAAPVVGAPFDDGGTYEQFRWVHEQSRSDLLDMIASRSYVIVRPEAERAAVLRDVADLLDSDPATAGATVSVPYITHVHRYLRP
ncbi:Ubiquinone/menaquinone biosynthesis C-methylase UbiE [Curtobacterium sp. UNCCL20]|uniref:class I SAM-dependent methyltransferase n=1 Tax=Curtobacterium sp. UNCCL20 TaxID=1502773 RepID=UPI000889209D|nr:class I SAM-dependent methyltransferase [Curtobacterium sp. UNCCL20]SDQ60930.1 Ubiquinone/menaquinone biosynthesis C-methylase UbiE [Curtobacterium sp. UNCCL20]